VTKLYITSHCHNTYHKNDGFLYLQRLKHNRVTGKPINNFKIQHAPKRYGRTNLVQKNNTGMIFS